MMVQKARRPPPAWGGTLQVDETVGEIPVKAARVFARDHVAALTGNGDLADRVELVVAELAANAIKHAGGPAFAVWIAQRRHLLADVIDLDPETLPVVREVSDDDEGGRGLLLVDALADEWFVYRRRFPIGRVKAVRTAFI